MSQPNPKPDYEYAAKRETRRLAAVTSPPSGGLGGIEGPADPAQEIGNLITQLQASSREAHERLAQVTRERDDLQSQLENVSSQLLDLRQRDEESRGKFVEVASVLRERDELSESVELHQKSIAELQRRLDAMQAKELEVQRQRGAVIIERDRALAERDAATRERDEARTRNAEAQKQVLSLRQARDSAQAQNRELSDKIQSLGDEVHELTHERDHARKQSGESDALRRERDELSAQLAARQQRDDELAQQSADAQKGRDELLASLTAAQKQIEYIARERDQVRQQGIDRALVLEAEAKAAVEKAAALEKETAAARIEHEQLAEKAQNFEQQRLAAIDLAAQLDSARREIKKLTADLAEARLEAKASHARPAPLPRGTPPPLPASVAPSRLAAPAPAAEIDDEVLGEKEAKGLLAEMKRCYTSFTKTPSDFSLLNELHCQLAHFAERSRVSGFLGLHRLSHAFGCLAQDLYKFPEQVNPSTLRTVGQTIELIGTLLKQKNYAALKDPAKSLVFAVDDDADNCDAIRMAMECISMRTRCAQEPAVALAEISADNYNLIFLDVALPHMDGFELCQHIRSLPNHARTPVVFLTGLTTIENRVQSSLSGGNDFVGKPFNLHELGVKAISLVLKASLHME